MIKLSNFIGIITLLLYFDINIYAQNIEGIDSTEGYIFSIVDYSGFPDSSTINSFSSVLLNDTLGLSKLISTNLSTQTNVFIDRNHISRLDSIITENIRGNILIEKGYPFLHIWSYYLLDTTSKDGTYVRDIFTEDIYYQLSSPSIYSSDITDGKIMNTLNPDNIINFCPFISAGLYCTITKVRIKCITFNESSIPILYDIWLKNSILGTKDKGVMKLCANSEFPVYTNINLLKNIDQKIRILLPISVEIYEID